MILGELPKLGIIGSAGRYGRWFAGFLAAHPYLVAEHRGHDPADLSSTAADALAAWADVLVFSVPVAQTLDVIAEFARHARERAAEQLWLDLTSIKAAPIAAMAASGAEVLGLHPMCAPPRIPNLAGQRLVVCDAGIDRWRRWVDALLDASGATLVRMDAADHDRCAARVQGLGHAAHLAQLIALSRSGLRMDELDACATPTFTLDLAMGMRLLAGDPDLYAGLIALTPDSRAALADLHNATGVMIQALDGDAPLTALGDRIRALQVWAGGARISAGEQAYLSAVQATRPPIG